MMTAAKGIIRRIRPLCIERPRNEITASSPGRGGGRPRWFGGVAATDQVSVAAPRLVAESEKTSGGNQTRIPEHSYFSRWLGDGCQARSTQHE